MSCASRDRARSSSGELCVRVRIVPLAQLVAVAERLVDDELAVVAERDLHPLERSGRRAFEVDAVLRVPRPVAGALDLSVLILAVGQVLTGADVHFDAPPPGLPERVKLPLGRSGRRAFEVDAVLRVPRPVAGTLELVLGAEPARRTAEVRADAEQRIEPVLRAHDPDALRLHPLLGDVAHRVLGGVARLEAGRGLEEDPREEKAEDGAARGGEAGEDRAPTREGEDVAPRPDEVSALCFGDAWIPAGHSTPSVASR